MKEQDDLGMIFYRYNHEDDLEVLLVNNNEVGEGGLCLPRCEFTSSADFEDGTGISATDNEEVFEVEGQQLPEFEDKKGLVKKALVLEAKMQSKVKKFTRIREEEGTYVAIKEAFKKIMPHEYEILHEMKEILIERNITRNI